MNVTRAIPMTPVVVEDPTSKGKVELAVYKDPDSGSIFAVDTSFIEQISVFIPGIFNSGTLQLDEDDQPASSNSRKLPISVWPDSDISQDDEGYGVTITVDVSATSFENAKDAFLNALAMGATDSAIFHIEHLRSGVVRELD